MSVEYAGPNYKTWQKAGIKRVYDLGIMGILKHLNLYEIGTMYAPRIFFFFYKYLQVRHYVYKKMNNLNFSNDSR